MTVSASTQIPKSSDPAVFQRQCKVLFECVLKDPTVKEFGSSGQKQSGIDLLGRRRETALDHWVGIQCKLTIKSEKLKRGILTTEATDALNIDPRLKEFILVTTAADDVEMDTEAARFTDAQARAGRDFTVQVWGWGTLETLILQHQRALEAFYPDAFPHAKRLLEGQERIEETLEGVRGDQGEIRQMVREMHVHLVSSRVTALDGTTLNTILDKQIDQYRDILTGGRPLTALDLLENLWKDLPPDFDGRIRFRIKANIAACKLHLGAEAEAGCLYLEAYEFSPTNLRAVSFKVLGLVLLDKASDAYALGLAELDRSQDKVNLLAYMLAAAKHLPAIENPLELIPRDIVDDYIIAIARIDYLRSLGQDSSWWAEARDAAQRHPSNKVIQRFSAESQIDEMCRWLDLHERGELDQNQRAIVKQAAGNLQHIWDTESGSEIFWDGAKIALGANLATAYRILQDYEAAKKIVDECLSHSPSDEGLIKHRIVLALESGDSIAALENIEKLPVSRDTIVGRLQAYANTDSWAAADKFISDINLRSLSAHDMAFCESIQLLARVKLNRVEGKKTAADQLLQKYPDEVVVPIILHAIAAQDSDDTWSAELFRTAISRTSTLDSASRMMLAQISAYERDAKAIVQLLSGHVDLNRDTPMLRILARGVVNAPVDKASIRFIDELSSELKKKAFFARLVGSIYFNSGALEDAEAAFQDAIKADNCDLPSHLALINTWLRQDNHDAIERHVASLVPNHLNGAPHEKMQLAQCLFTYGRAEEGLAFGYRTAVDHGDDVATLQLYIGLTLRDPSGALLPALTEDIQVDSSVSIERDDGTGLEIVIENDADRLSVDHYNSSHPFAQMLIGRKVGDIVTNTPSQGTEQTWKIVAHRSKYVALVHNIMKTFATRFPGATGLYTFEMKGSDVSPLLEQIKEISIHDEQLLNLYLKDNCPLSFVSALRGKSSIELAGHLIGIGKSIRACNGNAAERDQAIRAIRNAKDKGVVLDTYTAWIAQSLGLLPALKSLFTRVAISQSTLDEMSVWRQNLKTTDQQPLTTIGYRNGHCIRVEIPFEQLTEARTKIAAAIEEMRRDLDVLPAVAPDNLSPIESGILEIAPHRVLDPVFIALSHGLVLISEDMYLRNLAQQQRNLAGVWLQIVAMFCLESGIISWEKYADIVVFLAIHRHDYVALTSDLLVAIFQSDPSETLDRFNAVAAFIGDENADGPSHVEVASNFLSLIWRVDSPSWRQKKASSIILERIIGLFTRLDLLREGLAVLIKSNESNYALRGYIAGWLRGHFISFPSRPRKRKPRKKSTLPVVRGLVQ